MAAWLLDEYAVHIWLAVPEECREPALLSRYEQLLDFQERERYRRFSFASHRLQYLVARALVRTTLSHYIPQVAPADWRFVTNAYGRPQLPAAAGVALDFSLSHCDGLVVLAVARRQVGIDVERLEPARANIELAEQCFAPIEVADLARLPPEQFGTRFFAHWTLKESYSKARGLGLNLPLKSFGFHWVDRQTLEFCADAAIDRSPERWHFSLYAPSAEHLLALTCAAWTDLRLTWFSGLPVPRPAAAPVGIARSLSRRERDNGV